MPVDREVVETQLKELGDFHRFFTSKEIRYLPEILAAGETIYAVTSGFFDSKTWVIVITDARLIFLDTGMFYGLRQVDMPLRQISSVSCKTGFFFGDIEVSTPSGSQTIGRVTKRDVIKVVSILSSLIQNGQNRGKTANSIPPASDDLASQIERLASLHHKGLITDQEFTTAKAKLIN